MKLKTIILSIAIGTFALLSLQAQVKNWNYVPFNLDYYIDNSTDSKLEIRFNTTKKSEKLSQKVVVSPNSRERAQIESFGRGRSNFEVFLDDKKIFSGPLGPGTLPPFEEEDFARGTNLFQSISSTFNEEKRTAEFIYFLEKKKSKEPTVELVTPKFFELNFTIENKSNSQLEVQFDTERIVLGPKSKEKAQIMSFGSGESTFQIFVDNKRIFDGPLGNMLPQIYGTSELKKEGSIGNNLTYWVENSYDESRQTANFILTLEEKESEEPSVELPTPNAEEASEEALGTFPLLSHQTQKRDWRDVVFDLNFTIENKSNSKLEVQLNNQKVVLAPNSIEKAQIKSFGSGVSTFLIFVDDKRIINGPLGPVIEEIHGESEFKKVGSAGNNLTYSFESSYNASRQTANFTLTLDEKGSKEL